MTCEYYIQTELVIEYLDKFGRKSVVYTDRTIKKRYIFTYSDYNSDDDNESANKKINEEIQRKIAKNTYDKIIFDNDTWSKESYKKRYQALFKREFKEIDNIKKIYKKNIAWKKD
jgi:hypothetical protein